MRTTKFVKYSGNGNDFIILSDDIRLTPQAIEKLCHRHFGIGADGVITFGQTPKGDVRMRIYNADGGEAEMCGNGLRCLATYFDKIASEKKESYLIETMNAVYPVIRKGKSFALQMSEIKDKNIHDLSVFKDYKKSFFVNTGVPHLIFLTDDAKAVDVKKAGSFHRHHPMFPNGTNVTFVQVLDKDKKVAYARTYERGVEDETHSCGTGLTATALALSDWFNWQGDIQLHTKGGEQVVTVGEKVFYSGEVTECFKGEIEL